MTDSSRTDSAPGIDDVLAVELKEIRECMTALENGVSQDDWLEGWEEAFWASSYLLDAAEKMKARCALELGRREDEHDAEAE